MFQIYPLLLVETIISQNHDVLAFDYEVVGCWQILKQSDCFVPVISLWSVFLQKCDVLCLVAIVSVPEEHKQDSWICFLCIIKSLSLPAYQIDALPAVTTKSVYWLGSERANKVLPCFLSVAKGYGSQNQLAQNFLVSIASVGEYWNQNFTCSQ